MEQDPSRLESSTTKSKAAAPGAHAAAASLPEGEPTHVAPDAQRAIAAGARPAAGPRHVALPIGTSLQEYTIEGVLGSGSFGITYLARDNNLLCHVAIKEYLPSDLAVRTHGNLVWPRSDDDTEGYKMGLARFLAETRVLATFRHPNIIRVLRFLEANNTAYMVMDYERGESLRDWAPRHCPVTESELLRMFLPLLEGLDIVHASGVTHRDIKPANIYVRERDGSLVLLDFGAARNARSGRSRTVTTMVTPGYAPLEQYHSRGRLGPWSDIYALGGVLYWLVTGEKPIEAPSRVKEDTMKTASRAGTGRYSKAFLKAIDWALATDEERRPSNIETFRLALAGDIRIQPPKHAEAKANGSRQVATAMLVGAAILVIGALSFRMAPDAVTPAATVAVVAAPVPVPAPAAAPRPAPAPASAPNPVPSASSPVATTTRKPPLAKPPSLTHSNEAITAEPPAALPMAILTFEIRPENAVAEIRIDGIRVGMAPPMREFRLPAGKHRIEALRQHWMGSYFSQVEVRANERRTIQITFPTT